MKLLLLSDSNSPHTIRWAKSLCSLDIEVGIFSIHTPNPELYADSPKIKIFSVDISRNIQNQNETSFSKLVYFKSISAINKILNDFKPNILHAHYASSYGFLGALTGFHPFFISVWGSDVFGFPNYSIIHKKVIKYSLGKADKVFSTSRIMEIETRKFTNREIVTIPFGIDTERFKPKNVKRNFDQDAIVIGTIKTLEERYGIKYLIEAFAKVKNLIPDKNLKLFIVGQGTLKTSLENLALKLGIYIHTVFPGYIKHDVVQDYHNMIDIFCAVSLSESFGVAVLESSACGKPVIVSNVGGLPEVVDNAKTGFIVESKNIDQLAEAMIKLIKNQNLRTEMGSNGREKVINEYEWNSCVKKMINEYNYFLDWQNKL